MVLFGEGLSNLLSCAGPRLTTTCHCAATCTNQKCLLPTGSTVMPTKPPSVNKGAHIAPFALQLWGLLVALPVAAATFNGSGSSPDIDDRRADAGRHRGVDSICALHEPKTSSTCLQVANRGLSPSTNTAIYFESQKIHSNCNQTMWEEECRASSSWLEALPV